MVYYFLLYLTKSECQSFDTVKIISKHGINEEFGIGVIFILADRFANPPVKGVL